MKVTIIGAGNCGLAMAAQVSQGGHEVSLWNRTGAGIADLMAHPLIHCEGVLEGAVPVHRVTDDLALALESPDLVMVTTPAHAHKSLAQKMAPHLPSGVPVILNPGRTFGALEFKMTFEAMGRGEDLLIGETQTIIYTCRKTKADRVLVIAMKSDVLLSTFDARQNPALLARLPDCIRVYFKAADSMIQTSIGNVGMILHSAPLLLNAGWTENENNLYKYYYDGITPTISAFLEKMDLERLAVARALGRPVESTRDWLKRTYKIEGDSLYECLQNNEAYKRIDAPATLRHRYIFEDVPCGLVPLEAVGLHYGLDMTYTGLIIDLASRLMDEDFRKMGRNLASLGLDRGASSLLKLLESAAASE